jgi:hypothetical protein
LPEVMVGAVGLRHPGKSTDGIWRVGKAYAINDIITAKFFYPLGGWPEQWQAIQLLHIRHALADMCAEPEGLTGDVCETRRSLKEGETMEWILLSGVSSAQ